MSVRSFAVSLLCFFNLTLSYTPAQTPAPRVGVVAYCPAPQEQYQPAFAVSTLQNDGRFGAVSLVIGGSGVPALTTLQSGYDCVVAITDLGCGVPLPDAIADSAANTLAAYVQGGGGLVLTPFSFAQPRPSLGLGTAVFASGLSPLRGSSIYNSFGAGSISTGTMSNHPACAKIRDGVSGSMSSGLANDTYLAPDGKQCVSYQSGLPLAAVNPTGKVVGFNSFPSDQAAQGQANYRKLFANAVYQACTGNTASVGIAVPVDVKPASCPNVWQPKSKGVLPVAILGTTDVPADRIDPESIRLAGVAPLRHAIEDVGAPYLPATGKSGCTACNAAGGDGVVDLSLKFDSEALAAALPAGASDACVLLKLTGRLKAEFGGTLIQGEDVVSLK